jgi:nucleotide-binding universal stress UspA family protein
MKILLAADGSAYTAGAINFLSSHFDWFHSPPELHVLHVHPAIPIGRARAFIGKEAAENYYREESEAVLQVARSLLDAEQIAHTSTYRVGEIAGEIDKYVKANGIDLIVMGSHGHGALLNLVLGSIATKILATTEIPVLIIR